MVISKMWSVTHPKYLQFCTECIYKIINKIFPTPVTDIYYHLMQQSSQYK